MVPAALALVVAALLLTCTRTLPACQSVASGRSEGPLRRGRISDSHTPTVCYCVAFGTVHPLPTTHTGVYVQAANAGNDQARIAAALAARQDRLQAAQQNTHGHMGQHEIQTMTVFHGAYIAKEERSGKLDGDHIRGLVEHSIQKTQELVGSTHAS